LVRTMSLRMLILVFGLGIAAVKASDIDEGRMLQAIALVETADNDNAIGAAGERSRYQIAKITWRQHEPNLPHSWCKGTLADAVALRHLQWIRRNLPPEQRNDVAIVTACWNLGLTGYRQHGVNGYGQRVAAVYRLVNASQNGRWPANLIHDIIEREVEYVEIAKARIDAARVLL